MKKIIDCKTEIRKGELYQIKFYNDGSKEERRIDDAQMSKLMRAIMDQKEAIASRPDLKVIKGGKQSGMADIGWIALCALVWITVMILGCVEEDDRCVRPGWAKHKDCFGEPVDY
jgi:hypothetical protein